MVSDYDDEGRRIPRCMWEGKLRVLRELGEGAHGEVLLIQDPNFDIFAAKTAPIQSSAAEILEREYNVYKNLGCQGQKVKGLPEIHMYGVDPGHENRVLVMNRLGASLRDVMKLNGGTLPFYSVLRIGCQMLRRIEYVHSHGIVHGDIKPRNILCGLETFEKIYMVDFGLAAFFRDRRNKKQKPMTTGNEFQGTEDFASRHVHRGITLSRRDDLESLGYTLIFLMNGRLPWSRAPTEEELLEPPKHVDHVEILAKKERTTIVELCEGLPGAMEEYMRYISDMAYEEEPDYPFLVDIFMRGMKQLEDGGNFDNGEKLDIWPNARDKSHFTGLRDEDALWERYMPGMDNENAQNQGLQERHEDVQMNIEADGQTPEIEEGTRTCNPFQLLRSFKHWKPLLSACDVAESSKASTTQNGPDVWVGPRGRGSLFKRFMRFFRSASDDLDQIYLYYEEDSWPYPSDEDLW